jgi:hypothetical protein
MGKIVDFIWNMSLVQADHPTYTIYCRQDYQCSELRCDCEIRGLSGILLWGRTVWRHRLLVSSVKQVCLLSRPGNIVFGPAKNSFLLLFHTIWGHTNVLKGHVSIFSHVECCERLIAVSHQVLQFSVGNTRSYSIWTSCTVTFCKYMCCWKIFTKLDTMFCNNGIYRDVTLLVDGWCAMVCQLVHNLGEHVFFAWSHCLFKVMIPMFWWLSYFCSKDMLSGFAYILAGHKTSTVNNQLSTGNATFLHPFHCCSHPTTHVFTGCHSTTNLNRIRKVCCHT